LSYSSNHPLALSEVQDNIAFLASEYPHIHYFPDPRVIKYYNDKYRQYLFLKKRGYPIPETIPLYSATEVEEANNRLGYPMVVKNRYGAGGGSVYRVYNRKDLEQLFRISRLDLFNLSSAKYFADLLSKRLFYYNLIKAKQMAYPLLSPPLLAQKFVTIERDLKTVVGYGKVVEGHWRYKAHPEMWKVNIDDGGIGVWGAIPDEPIDLSIRLARDLQASWLNIDMIEERGRFLITEFSPVWHHYAYREKPTFEYREDYNIEIPLETSLDLERIIVESLLTAKAADAKG
jgi:glutathione synthase/RimK-type ligase-like ATP-grasp enzyme